MNQDIHKRLYVLLITTLMYVIVLHIAHLPVWVSIFSISFCTWRLLVAFDIAKPAKLIALAPLTVFVGIGILITYKGLIYRDSGVSLLLIMMTLKVLEAKSKRDYILITLLAYLLTGTLFLFSQTVITFLLSIPAIVLLTTALIELNRLPEMPTVAQSARNATKMLMQSMPLMLVLFIFFPRISQPLWGGSVSPSLMNTTGLSESIELNQISETVKNGSVAFRVKFKNKIPEQSQLYWRGPVLWHINGQRWEIASKHIALPDEQLTTHGETIEYTMTMEPNYHRWLVLLDMPNQAPDNATFSADRTVLAKDPTVARIRYGAQSWPIYHLGPEKLSKRAQKMSLQLTKDNPKAIALGRQWSSLPPEQVVQTALNFFQTENFIYTLNPPKTLSHGAIDNFLFSTQRGFCEHYATSFVYLMRAAGVPARVVTGYQGGEINNDYLIVRQSNAHAWAEVWLANSGWVRIDPTHAVAPDRVEQDISTAIQNSMNNNVNENIADTAAQESKKETTQLPIQERIKQYPLLHQSLLKWDSIENGWNQWVIDYNQNNQTKFISKLTGKPIALTNIVVLFIIASLITGLSMLAIFVIKNKSHTNKTQKLYAKFLKKLKPYKLSPYSYESATDFAQRTTIKLPHHQKELEKIAKLYNLLSYSRYSKISDDSLYITFANMINAFKPSDDNR